jgi:hypothetical protein
MQPERDAPEMPKQEQTQSPAPVQPEPQPRPIVTMAPDQPQTGDTMTMSPEPPPPEEPLPQPTSTPQEEPLRWQGTEYVHHEKDAMWFVVFAVIVVAFMAVSILIMRSVTFTILIPVMAAALIVYTRRPPRMIEYTLSSKGLYVNDQLYSFAEFKGFGVIRDAGEYSIMLIPVKRFRLGVSIYFPEEAGEAIVDILGTRLPMQEMQLDMFDRIIHKLRI